MIVIKIESPLAEANECAQIAVALRANLMRRHTIRHAKEPLCSQRSAFKKTLKTLTDMARADGASVVIVEVRVMESETGVTP